MFKAILIDLIATLFFLASSPVNAITPITECPDTFTSASINVHVSLSTNPDSCPLLEDSTKRELVNEFFPGTVFVYPTVPSSCHSGNIISGTISTEFEVINIKGTTESAQRIFAEAAAVNPSNMGVFIMGDSVPDRISFFFGAAVTVASLEDVNNANRKLTLMMSDHFSVTPKSNEEGVLEYLSTEELEIVGSNWATAIGRLKGTAVLGSPLPPFSEVPFTVQGDFCVK